MISQDQVIPLLIEACPSLRANLPPSSGPQRHASRPAVADLRPIAEFVVRAYSDGRKQDLRSLFAAFERLLSEGDDEVLEVISVGLFEDIQNIASHESFGASVFEPWLGPLGRQAWESVRQHWAGMPSLMAVLRAEAGQPPRPEVVPDLSQVQNPELAALLKSVYRSAPAAPKRPWWKLW